MGVSDIHFGERCGLRWGGKDEIVEDDEMKGGMRDRSRRTLVLVERVLELALFEEPVTNLPDLAGDAQRKLGFLAHVLAVDRILVLGVVLVHIAVAGRRRAQRRVVWRELAAVGDDARLDGHVPARGLGVLDRADHGLAADDLAEDDVLAVEVRRRVAGDEELRAVRVRARIRLCRVARVSDGAQMGPQEGDWRTMDRRKRFECFISKFSSSNFSP